MSQLSIVGTEIRLAFNHRVKTILKEPGKRGGAKKCGFIEYDPLVQKGLHSTNHRARARTRPSSTLTRTCSNSSVIVIAESIGSSSSPNSSSSPSSPHRSSHRTRFDQSRTDLHAWSRLHKTLTSQSCKARGSDLNLHFKIKYCLYQSRLQEYCIISTNENCEIRLIVEGQDMFHNSNTESLNEYCTIGLEVLCFGNTSE
ncbi:hypothetical protein Scep_022131 [Stephania cephalantha]|uniref:Uncharacterized protein n=1 Tax=Stephania cephalantha TaxID=152367 RepID=A0AAP0FAB0_9MAGN